VPALVDAIWRVRPLAMVLVETEMNRALEDAAGDYLGDRVAAIMEKRLGNASAGRPSAAPHEDTDARVKGKAALPASTAKAKAKK